MFCSAPRQETISVSQVAVYTASLYRLRQDGAGATPTPGLLPAPTVQCLQNRRETNDEKQSLLSRAVSRKSIGKSRRKRRRKKYRRRKIICADHSPLGQNKQLQKSCRRSNQFLLASCGHKCACTPFDLPFAIQCKRDQYGGQIESSSDSVREFGTQLTQGTLVTIIAGGG